MITVILLLFVGGSLAIKSDWCASSNIYSFPLKQTGIKLYVDLPEGFVFKWDVVSSGNQLIVDAPDDIFIWTKIGDGEVTIKALLNDDLPKRFPKATCSSFSGPLNACFFLSWFAVSCMVFMFTPFKSKTIWIVFVIGISISWTASSSHCNCPTIHAKLPLNYISEVCTNEKCMPSSCDLGVLSLDSGGYNRISASNRDIFEADDCRLKRPAHWYDWVIYHFQFNVTDEEFFFIDSDNDGLANILEYYSNGATQQQSFSVALIGSNPTLPDTDKDLLLDGFETFFGMSPTEADDSNSDDDNDGLSNLLEQIYGSDPLNADSDGDGVADGTEVDNQGNPTDATDEGSQIISNSFAMINLTIGDPSGSHSERYNLHVGTISHQAPDFGVVGEGTYKFVPGTYRITVQWVATNLGSPDYDYIADVSKVSGNANITIEDPHNILGEYYDSYYDRTAGKEATLIVEGNCANTNSIFCINTCEECEASPSQHWNANQGRCVPSTSESSASECPCAKCEKWYKEELRYNSWREELNTNVPCPCEAKGYGIGLTSGNFNPEIKWSYDWACLRNSLPTCSSYHPGAYGCIRSEWRSHRQQCCYDSDLDWIPSGSPAAGTPDRAHAISDHISMDVEPFEWCCKQCNQKKYCDYYLGVGGVRTGPTTCSYSA